MILVRCQFCHKLVLGVFYPSHRAKHTRQLRDGQMTEHITVHPKGRYRGSLRDIPRAYRHPECGVTTGMPEDIIRSYLVNPFLYSGGSFCCRCNDYIPYDEFFWIETGICLNEYFQGLQDDYLDEHGEPPPRAKI